MTTKLANIVWKISFVTLWVSNMKFWGDSGLLGKVKELPVATKLANIVSTLFVIVCHTVGQ